MIKQPPLVQQDQFYTQFIQLSYTIKSSPTVPLQNAFKEVKTKQPDALNIEIYVHSKSEGERNTW